MARPDIQLTSTIADRIIGMLEDAASDPAAWRRRMTRLNAECGPEVHTVLLFVLTHLEFPPEKAREHWGRILRQWEEMNRSVPEKVDLRVAVLQYFLRIQRKLRNPAIVEIRILRQTQDSVMYDELTRLYNYRYFQDRVRTEARRAERYDSPLTLLMIDADDFKGLNDTCGHLAGNMALRRLAAVLRKSVREVDVVARYGGEEFAVLLPNTPKLAALRVAEKLRQAVEKAGIGRREDPGWKAVTVSVGVASLPGDATAADELIECADRALYAAKSLGKNCVRPFSDERREFTRRGASVIGRFSAVESQSHPLTTLNLSEGGLLFLCDQPLAAGALVRVQLSLPPARQLVECVVRVVRVLESRGGCEIGGQIIHMPRLHQHRFRLFLRALKSEDPPPEPAERRTTLAPTSGRTPGPAGP
jgi:diguanylate cyclase (GGDEF)-like protein